MGIRLAEAADRAAVEAIVRAAYEPWVPVLGVTPRPLAADYGELIERERVHVLGNGEIDALIVLSPQDDALLVENVAVRPDRQGRGLGRRLMTFAEFHARSLGAPAVRLRADERMTANLAWYASLGYRETGREGDGGRKVVHLRKAL